MDHSIYANLDPRHNMQPHLPRILNREVYFKGRTIIKQGSQGFHAYYIESGRVEIIVHEGKHELSLTELGPGEIFGEMALIEHGYRSASVKALEDTTVTIISASDIEPKINEIADKAVSALMHVFIERLQQSNLGQLKQYKNLACFQDRITGLVEKVGRGINEDKRSAFRKDVEPILEQLDDLLEKYRE